MSDARDSTPEEDGYDGVATIVVDGEATLAQVRLRGVFQPIDGRYHWYGRVRVDDADDDLSGTEVEIRTSEGLAQGKLSDVDPWGRYRIAGQGRPPFRRLEPGALTSTEVGSA